MKGEILNLNSDSGIVLGEDGERYLLSSNVTSDNQKLFVGAKIDFIVGENRSATDVYLLKNSSVPFDVNSLNDGTTRSAAIIATIGAGLGVLSIIPGIGFLFAIGGMITELIGVKKLANLANNQSIFQNMLWGTIAGIIGICVVTIVGAIGLGMSALSHSSMGMGFTAVVSIVIALAISIYSILKIFKALKGLSTAYNVNILSISAWLYAVGMILLPFGIGALILMGYFITKVIGYLSIK